MTRLKQAALSGTVTDAPLASGAVTLNSANLAAMQAVVNPNMMVIILDPLEVYGDHEVIHVTAHTALATSATILRGREGTVAREHVAGTTWYHGPTIEDYSDVNPTRFAFLEGRRKYAEFSGTFPGLTVTQGDMVGLGLGAVLSNNGTIKGTADAAVELSTSATSSGAARIVSMPSSASIGTCIRPDQSPTMLVSITPPAGAAALAAWSVGFATVLPSVTASGAYLRRTTTGNVFFATRESGTETTTDLGNITTRRRFIIESPDAGVTWNLFDADNGTVLASHTTNVPTAATLLGIGVGISNNTTIELFTYLEYMRVEADHA